MHLKQIKRNGRVYLSIVQNYRERGVTRTRTIETIGYADQYADLYPNPIAHFKDKVREMNRRQREENEPLSLSFSRGALIDENASDAVQLGSAIALGFLDALGIGGFFEGVRASKGLAPHTARVFEMLAVGRFMSPASRKSVWAQRTSFPRACDFSPADMGRALADIADCDQDLVKRLNTRYEQLYGARDTSTIYLVMNSTVFTLDDRIGTGGPEQGDALAGAHATLRMSIVTDASGMPLGYRLMPERFDLGSSIQFIRELKREYDASKVVLVTENSPYLTQTMAQANAHGDSYVMRQPLHQATPELRNWILDQEGYRSNASGSFRVKSRITARAVPVIVGTDTTDEVQEVPVKEIVIWSRDRSVVQANRRAQQKLRSELIQSQINDTREFRTIDAGDVAKAGEPLEPDSSVAPDSSVVPDSSVAPDSNRIENADGGPYPLLDGYTCFISNETEGSDAAVFHTYRETWRLTEPFETQAEDFASPDWPITLRANIRAHFLICYTAFFAMRLLRMHMGNQFNASQVAQALQRMRGIHLQDNWYLFSYRSDVTDAVQRAAGIDVARRVLSKGDVRKVMAQVKRHVTEAPSQGFRP